MKDLSEYDLRGSGLINFRWRAAHYCNGNEDAFRVGKNGGVSLKEASGDEYAEAALLHYNYGKEGACGSDLLEGRHAEQFKRVAKQLHEDGRVPHAGASVR